ncbi:DMT family transporter [uncultured Brevibacillus sp.]|uniref:DMT family transporter n=1 Tax=uncultured Brevibacillus sp. TaxID=169970 RepID=UPI00259919AA|nr:DMT family transporter [uncultured Brevibacillus sp.]
MKTINYLLLLGIGIIWGSQFFFVDLVIGSITPITLAAYKAILGTITLAVLHLFNGKKERLPAGQKVWSLFIWIAILEAVVPFILIGWGQQYINSNTASILLGTVPIFTKIAAPQEKLPFRKWVSIFIGFGGLCLLFGPTLSSLSFSGNVMGYLALVGASMSFALSLILIKRLPPISSILAMRNVLFVASVLLLPLAILFEEPFHIRLGWQQVIDVIILGVVQGGIVYMLYNTLIRRTNAAFASLTNYLVPLFGILLGTLILGDQVAWNSIAALVVIFISLAIGEKS